MSSGSTATSKVVVPHVFRTILLGYTNSDDSESTYASKKALLALEMTVHLAAAHSSSICARDSPRSPRADGDGGPDAEADADADADADGAGDASGGDSRPSPSKKSISSTFLR